MTATRSQVPSPSSRVHPPCHMHGNVAFMALGSGAFPALQMLTRPAAPAAKARSTQHGLAGCCTAAFLHHDQSLAVTCTCCLPTCCHKNPMRGMQGPCQWSIACCCVAKPPHPLGPVSSGLHLSACHGGLDASDMAGHVREDARTTQYHSHGPNALANAALVQCCAAHLLGEMKVRPEPTRSILPCGSMQSYSMHTYTCRV